MKRDLKAKELQVLESSSRRSFQQQQDRGASKIQEREHGIRRLEQVIPHSLPASHPSSSSDFHSPTLSSGYSTLSFALDDKTILDCKYLAIKYQRAVFDQTNSPKKKNMVHFYRLI